MGRFWLAAIFIFLIGFAGCISPPATATVIQVTDGDTIVVEGNYRVRYIGIDTPEIRPTLEAAARKAGLGIWAKYKGAH
ncbi:MAG: hypothetical protein H8D49_01000 [Dehalococcoidia bacterium]|nr:hypothetical protein [Dehalococcoidia bacterium]MBL7126698.1 hypothetical protein [Dehalococcoidales bacterium]